MTKVKKTPPKTELEKLQDENLDSPYLGTGCNDYGNKDALKILQSIVECCAYLPFLLFGDASISFWYEVLFRGEPVTKYTKDINTIGMNHTKRTEVLFSRLPGEGGQPWIGINGQLKN